MGVPWRPGGNSGRAGREPGGSRQKKSWAGLDLIVIVVGPGVKPGGPRQKEGWAGRVPWRPGSNSGRAGCEAWRPRRRGQACTLETQK